MANLESTINPTTLWFMEGSCNIFMFTSSCPSRCWFQKHFLYLSNRGCCDTRNQSPSGFWNLTDIHTLFSTSCVKITWNPVRPGCGVNSCHCDTALLTEHLSARSDSELSCSGQMPVEHTELENFLHDPSIGADSSGLSVRPLSCCCGAGLRMEGMQTLSNVWADCQRAGWRSCRCVWCEIFHFLSSPSGWMLIFHCDRSLLCLLQLVWKGHRCFSWRNAWRDFV